MYFEADRFVSCPWCGQDHLALVPGCGLFEAEDTWVGPTWTQAYMGGRSGIVALMSRPHRCPKGQTRSQASQQEAALLAIIRRRLFHRPDREMSGSDQSGGGSSRAAA
jgi:hypothetical protein